MEINHRVSMIIHVNHHGQPHEHSTDKQYDIRDLSEDQNIQVNEIMHIFMHVVLVLRL